MTLREFVQFGNFGSFEERREYETAILHSSVYQAMVFPGTQLPCDGEETQDVWTLAFTYWRTMLRGRIET